MFEELEVIVRVGHGEAEQVRVVSIPVREWDSVLCLKRRLAAKEGFPPEQQKVVFNGVELEDRDTLRGCGLRTVHGMEVWAGDRIFGNGWFLMGSARKPFSLVRGGMWPQRVPEPVSWLFGLAGFVVVANVILASGVGAPLVS